MAHTIYQPLRSLLINGTHRFATCWKIERTDAVTFRFTDHDTQLIVNGETYSPAGSFSASARQRKEGTAPQNLEIIGFLDSSYITEDDLRSGKYRNAKVTEITVNWAYPWAGSYGTNIYYIQEVTYDSEGWTAKLEGLAMRLKPKTGALFTRTCRWTLGDTQCQVNVAALTIAGTVDVVSTNRLQFTATLSGGDRADDYYTDGLLVWTSGPNNGLTSEIQLHVGDDTDILLHVNAFFDIEVGNTFTIRPGCDKTIETCKEKFSNVLRFGGFPDIPGTDTLYSTPDARRT